MYSNNFTLNSNNNQDERQHKKRSFNAITVCEDEMTSITTPFQKKLIRKEHLTKDANFVEQFHGVGMKP